MFYLPLSISRIDALLEAGDTNDYAQLITSYTPAELASLVFLIKSPALDYTLPITNFIDRAEHMIARLVTMVNGEIKQIVTALSHQAILSASLPKQVSRLERHGIFLMTEADVKGQEYLEKVTREWRYGWRPERASRALFPYPDMSSTEEGVTLHTMDQVRLMNTFAAEPEESLHVQAVAGAGKTRFIVEAIERVDPDATILLAMTFQQIEALKSRLNRKVHGQTFNQLADYVIQKSGNIHIPMYFERKKIKSSIEYSTLAKLMGYHDLSEKVTSKMVAEIVTRTVNSFCYSSDRQFLPRHIPKYYLPLLQHTMGIVLTLAQELWMQIINPTKDLLLPLHGYHRIKLWAMSDEGIPAQFQYCFVDEAHDLPSPILQILDRCHQSVITLGDSYQAIGKSDNLQRRSHKARHRIMSNSYRVGHNSNTLFNKLLSSHPEKPTYEFSGRRDKATKITTYRARGAKPYNAGPCAILSTDPWHLFKAMLFLSDQDTPFAILPATKNEIVWLVEDAIRLYSRSVRPTHRAYYRYDQWHEFYANQSTEIQAILDRTIGKGFSMQHLQKHISKALGDMRGVYVLARIEDCKNLEFSRVMLLEDVFPEDGVLGTFRPNVTLFAVANG